jgi:formylglycine-generating enzyme required for sulfatase activity
MNRIVRVCSFTELRHSSLTWLGMVMFMIVGMIGNCFGQSDEMKTFQQLDQNEDGFLSGTEIGSLRKLDADGNGRITRQEFLRGAAKPADNANATDTQPTQLNAARPARPLTDWDRSLQKQLTAGSGWLITIGVDDYKGMPLHCCVADAKLIAATLEQRCGFPADQILLLTDKETDPDHLPTKSNLKSQIAAVLKQVQPNDIVVVFFAGHGMLLKEAGYLCPLDFDGKQTAATGWKIDELRLLLQECRAARKLLILDSCHSGGSSGKAAFGSSGQEVGAEFEHAQGQITLSSCRAHELSQENRAEGHGLFTLSFARGMEGFADFDQNGIVDSDEIYRHVLSEVPALAREQDLTQHQTPVRIIGQDVVGVFALASVRLDLPVTTNRRSLRSGDVITNSIGMSLVMLPKGVYIKGSPLSEYKRGDDEEARAVMLTNRLLMGKFEVSQSEYQAVMDANPSYYKPQGQGDADLADLSTDRFPVEQVSWNDAVEFCKRLSAQPAEQKAGRIYRLPTESEWEFACRANSLTAFNVGEVIEGNQANIKSEKPYWYAKSVESLGRTRTIGSYPANAFGLCDMHGNVAEWCADYYEVTHAGSYRLSGGPKNLDDVIISLEGFSQLIEDGKSLAEATNPTGPRQGTTRVVRGGSFNTEGGQARSAARRQQLPDFKHRTIGFRVICEQRLIAPPAE